MDVSDVLTQMQAQGLVVEALKFTGDIVRVPVSSPRPDKGGKKSGWYVVYEFRLRSGETAISGAFGNYKYGHDHSFKIGSPGQRWSDEDRREFEAKRKEALARAQAERERLAEQCRVRAQQIWSGLPDEGKSPYLDKKRVRAYGVRFTRGSIVVPLHRLVESADGPQLDLVGLQFIAPDGSKKFLTGTPKKAAFHLIGKVEDLRGRVLVVEGYATGASVHIATGLPVVVAFDAGNLEPVAVELERIFSPTLICFAGDNDAETEGNPGLEKAKAAAARVGGVYVVPQFDEGQHAA